MLGCGFFMGGPRILGVRRALRTTTLLALVWSLLYAQTFAQGLAVEKLPGLSAFVDSTMARLMEQEHVSGGAVAIVHDGQVLLQQAYGQSDLESGQQVDVARTLFRIGSVSKLFTALAAMQLVDAGKLDLQRDVRTYLPEMPIPYGATTHQLLTHTAGFDERFAGAYTDSPAHWVPLAEHLRLAPPAQVKTPGMSYSYSNYHYALVGRIIERLSGQTYERYVADRIFAPLKMTATTASQPPELPLADRARGYQWGGDRQIPLPFRLTYAAPSGGISASAGDMARLMLALLGEGKLAEQRILSSEAVRTLLGPRYTPHPRIPAQAYGATHWATRGQDLVYKDGTLGDQVGAVVLAPAHNLGIFATWNSPVAIGRAIESVVTYLFGPEAPPPPPIQTTDALTRTPALAGTYRNLHRTRNDLSSLIAILPMMQSEVAVEPDGSIRWQGRRWIEVEPLVFRSTNTADHIVFRADIQGRGESLHAWGTTYERIGWSEQTWFHVGVLAVSAIAFVTYAVQHPVSHFRRRRVDARGRLARRVGLVVAIANLTFLVGLVGLVRGLGGSVPLPAHQVAWLSLPLLTLGPTLVLPLFAWSAWRKDWWTSRGRVSYTVYAVVCLAFTAFLNHWNLLGYHY